MGELSAKLTERAHEVRRPAEAQRAVDNRPYKINANLFIDISRNVCYNVGDEEVKSGLTFNKTEEVTAMTLFEVISTVISLLELIAVIIFGILGLTTGDKKK